jgi:hypothetical protein
MEAYLHINYIEDYSFWDVTPRSKWAACSPISFPSFLIYVPSFSLGSYSSTLKLEAAGSSKPSTPFCQTTWHLYDPLPAMFTFLSSLSVHSFSHTAYPSALKIEAAASFQTSVSFYQTMVPSQNTIFIFINVGTSNLL